MIKILAFLSLTILLLGYQNCGKQMDFYKSSDKVNLNGDAAVVPTNDVTNDDISYVVGDVPNDDISDVVSDVPNDDISDVIHTGANDDHGLPTVPDNGQPQQGLEDGVSPQSDLSYICILKGPGASQRLGYIDSQLAINGSTPRTICTTERACLDIASKKYDVVSAEPRGFCKNGKAHAVSISEHDLEVLINQ